MEENAGSFSVNYTASVDRLGVFTVLLWAVLSVEGMRKGKRRKEVMEKRRESANKEGDGLRDGGGGEKEIGRASCRERV